MHVAKTREVKQKVQALSVWSFVLLFALLGTVVWGFDDAGIQRGTLRVIFFDVGQGDAALIETPSGIQVLVDGGKGRIVLQGLGRELSFFDKTIDMVVATHPDLDHIGGLPYVFARYEVPLFLSSGIEDDGADNMALIAAVADEGARSEIITEPYTLLLDDGVQLDVLFPDRDVRKVEANTGSVVLRLTYGATSFLFTGDAPTSIETHLIDLYGDALKSTVLKLGHHGSNTSSALPFLGYVSPEYAVVSAGCDNSYGHPHTDVINNLHMLDVTVLDTCTHGDIVFVSDGGMVSVQ